MDSRDAAEAAELRDDPELLEEHWSYMDGFAESMIAAGRTLDTDRGGERPAACTSFSLPASMQRARLVRWNRTKMERTGLEGSPRSRSTTGSSAAGAETHGYCCTRSPSSDRPTGTFARGVIPEPSRRVVDTRRMARFVLVHGAWHGGWCFRWLAEELEDRGHDVADSRPPCEDVGLTPLDYARGSARSRTRSLSAIRSADSRSRTSRPAPRLSRRAAAAGGRV